MQNEGLRFIRSEAGAITIWLFSLMIMAAFITPWLYDVGKSFASHNNHENALPALRHLAGSCERARTERYFSRALLLSALVLLPFLYRRIAKIHSGSHLYALQPLSWKSAAQHLTIGLIIGTTALGLLSVILFSTNAAELKLENFRISSFFSKALLPAIGAGLVEECMFRGVLLGLMLRSGKTTGAMICSSLIFAFLHFLKPPSGSEVTDPTAWCSGFIVLAEIFKHITNPQFFLTNFATFTLLGLLLAHCRIRTRSLWLPIGLHIGLVLAVKSFGSIASLDPSSKLHPWWVGQSLASGILPLIILGMCFYACQRLLPHSFGERTSPQSR